MPTHQTEHYQLNQWEAEDKVLRTDFNADNAKIDAALAAKAEASAVSALAQTVAGKADASTLNSVAGQVTSHTTLLSKKGNCEIWTTTYTGKYTQTSPEANRITFPSRPAAAFIISYTGEFMALAPGAEGSLHMTAGSNSNWAKVSWEGRTVSLTSPEVSLQMNQSGRQYLVVALIAKG